MNLLVVCDIDATISDATDRFRIVGPDPGLKDMPAYLSWVEAVNENMGHDEPVKGMRDFIRALYTGGAHIIYLTSREEKHREVTEDWLYQYGFPQCEVMMREDGSYSEVMQYKGTIIKNMVEIFGFSNVVVIDDSSEMVSLCRNKGYTLLRAMSGGVL